MDFNQVRYFLALADTLNFTRAAEQCYVSQPALTQAIKRLEIELGGELIRRDGRYTELTELGKLLRGHFEQIDHTRRLVQATAKSVTSGEIAELNIGLMCTIGPRLLSDMLDAFQLQYPMVSIILHDVTPETIPELLLSGALHGVFCTHGEPSHAQLRYIDLFEERMVVAFPSGHVFLEREAVPLRDVAQYRYIDRLHCEFRSQLLMYCETQDIALDVAFRSQREDWIQSLIRDGMGVSMIPRYSLLRPELDYRPIVDPTMSRQVALVVVEHNALPPALVRLIEQASRHNWPINV